MGGHSQGCRVGGGWLSRGLVKGFQADEKKNSLRTSSLCGEVCGGVRGLVGMMSPISLGIFWEFSLPSDNFPSKPLPVMPTAYWALTYADGLVQLSQLFPGEAYCLSFP